MASCLTIHRPETRSTTTAHAVVSLEVHAVTALTYCTPTLTMEWSAHYYRQIDYSPLLRSYRLLAPTIATH